MAFRRRALPSAIMLMALLVLSIAPPFAQTARAATPEVESARAAAKWLRTQQLPDGGFAGFGGESDAGATADAAQAFAAADVNPDSVVSAEGNSAVDFLIASAPAESADPGRAAKIALALQASGMNPRDVGGVDLISAIEGALDPVTGRYGQSFYGHLLAVLALHATSTTIPQQAIEAIYAAQVEDGAWGFIGDITPGTGDSNTTALAVQTLAAIGGRTDAINAGLEYLKSVQADSGAIAYDAATLTSAGGDANSTALAIQAFVAAGQDPEALPKGSLIAALLSFQNPSGAFQFQPSFPDDNVLATAQAVPALMLEPYPIEPVVGGDPVLDAMEPATPISGCVFYEATQHNVCEPFASYWEMHGGLANFGYPLTEAFEENGLTVQYFERQRFEHHAELAGTPYEVLLTRVGADAVERPESTTTPADRNTSAACEYFPETGHNLCSGFRAFWHEFGGLMVFGYPLTEEIQEGGMTVQYFERARFEWQPGTWPERYDVLLTRLGAEAIERELAR